MARKVKRYDHRIRNMIVRSRNPNLFPELDISKSTIRDWLRKGTAGVVTVPEFELSNEELLSEIQVLTSKLAGA